MGKKSLNYKYNTLVDKPITSDENQLKELIEISKKNKKLLAESTFFNYHLQMKKIIRIHKFDKFKKFTLNLLFQNPIKKVF